MGECVNVFIVRMRDARRAAILVAAGDGKL
jgi:hypothetical protein